MNGELSGRLSMQIFSGSLEITLVCLCPFLLIANASCCVDHVFQVLLLGRGRRGDLLSEGKSTFVLDQTRLVSLVLLLDCRLVPNSPFMVLLNSRIVDF